MREPTEEQFLKDVAGHEMTVLADVDIPGVKGYGPTHSRCLRFAKKDQSWHQYFYITTWPGYLCINGDMGCFVFARLPDMFEFFRTPEERPALSINPDYWGEKCEAADRRTGALDAYDADKFRAAVTICSHDYFDESPEPAKTECWEELSDLVLNAENEYEAYSSARDFKHEQSGFELTDFWECKFRSWTYQYLWCSLTLSRGPSGSTTTRKPMQTKGQLFSAGPHYTLDRKPVVALI